MLSSCIIVGRVKEKPEIRTTSKGNTIAYMLLEVERPFRNEDGPLTTDIFRVVLWRGIAEECAASWHEGSVLVVRGRIETRSEEGKPHVRLIGEKVSLVREAQ